MQMCNPFHGGLRRPSRLQCIVGDAVDGDGEVPNKPIALPSVSTPQRPMPKPERWYTKLAPCIRISLSRCWYGTSYPPRLVSSPYDATDACTTPERYLCKKAWRQQVDVTWPRLRRLVLTGMLAPPSSGDPCEMRFSVLPLKRCRPTCSTH